MRLSFSTIASCLQVNNSHNWINKISGITIPQTEAMKNGKRLHRIIQDHVKIKNPIINKDLPNIRFPIIEEKDKDEKTHFNFKISAGFKVHGYLDGLNPEKGEILEIKTGSVLWGIGDFMKHPQLWVYAYCNPDYNKFYCLTALSDEKLWERQPPKVYEIPITDSMCKKGEKYIMDAIDLYNRGNFKGGLDEAGRCSNYCSYGNSCLFK